MKYVGHLKQILHTTSSSTVYGSWLSQQSPHPQIGQCCQHLLPDFPDFSPSSLHAQRCDLDAVEGEKGARDVPLGMFSTCQVLQVR